MTTRYVRSTDGSDASDGLTWANAEATFAGAAAADAAGDVIWVSQVHAESTAAAVSWDWAGSAASPTRIICGNDAAEPPTALATTATVTTTGDNGITAAASGDWLYVYGISFIAGSGGTGTASILLGSSTASQLTYESCVFNLASTGTSSVINTSSGTVPSLSMDLVDCDFQFSATAQSLSTTAGKLHIKGGSILSDAAITTFSVINASCDMLIEGFDFTNAASTLEITSGTSGNCRVIVRDCKMPASWSGSINSGTPGPGSVFELFNCDDGDTNYIYQRKTQWGTIDTETTIVRTGGASDGTTTISWKMVTNANAEWTHQTLDSPEMVRWNETTGSAITVTVEFVHDSLTNMQDDEIWLEVQYLGTSGTPLSLFVDDAAADYITTAADQTDSSETWTTTGLTNPNTQKLSVSFTPQEKGFIHAVVRVAVASKTVYVDPELTVS